MQKLLNGFWREENGQDMVEYSLLLAVAALAGVGVLTTLRSQSVGTWQAISAEFATAAS